MKFCIIHTGEKIGKKSKHKMNERKTNFRHEGNSLTSHMKYFNYSSSSKAPLTAAGYGCCGGWSRKEEQTTEKREHWEGKGRSLKTVVRRNSSVGHPQLWHSWLDYHNLFPPQTLDVKKNLHRSMESGRQVSRYRTLYSQVLQ